MKTIIFVLAIALCALQASNAQSVESYIQENHQLAQKVDSIFGIPASICLAQAISSGYGLSPLAQNNNHFGYNSEKYPNKEACYMAYGEYVSKLVGSMPNSATVEQWAEKLQNCPAFSELGYSNQLIELLYKYNLKRFDHN